MRLFTFSLIFLFVLSCSNEAVIEFEEFNYNQEILLEDYEIFKRESSQNMFFSDYLNDQKSQIIIENHRDTQKSVNRCGGNNILNLCNIITGFKTNGSDTYWNIGHNNKPVLDGFLDLDFNSNWMFNLRLIKKGEPVFIANATIDYLEEPDFFGEYIYTNDNYISSYDYEKIRQHFACEIKEFVDLYHPGYYIYDVDFYGDALLCGSSVRTISVNFKVGY
jgi:hypothetical protein